MSDTSLTSAVPGTSRTFPAEGAADIRAHIREFLQQRFAGVRLTDDQDIFATGLVNSLFAMELVLFLEKVTGARIPNTELAMDNFRSIDAMTQLAGRMGAAPSDQASS